MVVQIWGQYMKVQFGLIKKGGIIMKCVLKIIGSIIIIFIFSITNCFAAQNNNIKQLMDKDSINNSVDKNDFFEEYDKNENTVKDLLKKSQNIDIKGIKKDMLIKAYKFNSSDFVFDYKKDKDFNKTISKKYFWLGSAVDNNEKYVSMITFSKEITADEFDKLHQKYKNETEKSNALANINENNGKWIVGGIGKDLLEDQFNFISDSSKVEKFLLRNGIKNPSEIKFVLAESHKTNILYIKEENKEYGIPFGRTPEFTGLQNGKLYSITDIVNILAKISNTTNTQVNTDGGGTNNSKNLIQNKITITIAITILFSAAVLFIIFWFKKLRNAKH